MCGLVAVVSKYSNGLSKEQVDVFNDLLYIDALRGMDSTGVFMVDKNGSMDLAKEATDAADFRRKKEYQDLLGQAFRTGAALVGHNRAATRGVINDENAHPFVVDDRITLVHNGTLFGDHKKLADTEVDSHAIAHTIHNHGDDVEKALQEINGAYALIWHDFKNKTLNFVRNSARPLHVFEAHGAWIWASEASMLEWVIARHKITPSKPDGGVLLLNPSVLAKFTQTNNQWTLSMDKIELDKPITKYTSTYSGQSWPPGYRGGIYGMEDDDIYGAYNTKKEEEPRTNVLQLPNTNGAGKDNYTRIKYEEEKIAASQEISLTATAFGNFSGYHNTGDAVVGVCLEFIQVVKDNPKSGWWLYAAMEDEPDLLLKVYLPHTIPDTEILDLTLNNRRRVFTVNNKCWSSYQNKSIAKNLSDGYGIINASKMEDIIVAAA